AGLAVLSAFDKLTVFPDVLLNNHERQYAEPNLRYLLQMHAPVPAGDRGRAVFPESPHPPGPHWEYQIVGLAASGIQKSDVPANLCYTSDNKPRAVSEAAREHDSDQPHYADQAVYQ